MKQIQTSYPSADHIPDFGKMVMRTSATDHFVGVNKMVACHPRAKGAITHQPRATPWELVHPIIQQP